MPRKKRTEDLPNPFGDVTQVKPKVSTPEVAETPDHGPTPEEEEKKEEQTSSLEQTIAVMAKQMSALVEDQAQMREELKRARAGGPTPTRNPNEVPTAKEAMAQIMRTEEIERSTEQAFWARMTPFNQDVDNVAHTRGFGYLKSAGGEYLKGGTGLPGDVPQWRRVTKEEAIKLSFEKQHATRRYSKAACQIVTNKGKAMIDSYEESFRYRSSGMRAVSVGEAALSETHDPRGGIVDDGRPALATPQVNDMAEDTRHLGDGSGRAVVGEIGPDQQQAAAQVLADLPSADAVS